MVGCYLSVGAFLKPVCPLACQASPPLMATPNKSRVRAEAKKSSALDSNNSVTQGEASLKCKNCIDEHPDKVLHLYGMMSLGLCDPKTGAGSSTDLATSTKAGGTRNIPHSKTTLGAVSFSHFRAAMVALEPKSEKWMDDQFGMELAPELFFFFATTNPAMRVHDHAWSKFIFYRATRLSAGSSVVWRLMPPSPPSLGTQWGGSPWTPLLVMMAGSPV